MKDGHDEDVTEPDTDDDLDSFAREWENGSGFSNDDTDDMISEGRNADSAGVAGATSARPCPVTVPSRCSSRFLPCSPCSR
ncbi:hypothetical protein D2E23_1572 [Bifidobacterium callimiconis]|uniref:Uncharacterized protein n=1 Tax=Bifidobacterium callimiconis TaxID=2306973 RepID=A0A430FCI3_9BIFI|nr:hypothetical protein D2E23_1572 [Bifidobacterium callimiconis]